MAMSTGKGRGSLSEINVTPLVDVMLVLLVVFMVTTPMIVEDLKQRQVDVDLPTTNSEQPVKQADVKTIIILKGDFTVGLDTGAEGPDGEPAVSTLAECAGAAQKGGFAECLGKMDQQLAANPKLKEAGRIFLMADRGLPYGFVVDVMARLRNAGLVNLGMVTNPPEGPPG